MTDGITWEAERTIECVLSEVARRGWTQTSVTLDNFGELRKDQRIQDAQLATLYELYFLPERHEFEWEVLVAIGSVVALGVAGNAAYDLIKSVCSFAASKFQSFLGAAGAARGQGFSQIADDAESLSVFFSTTKRARIADIEEKTSVPREKILPLMKLAGFNHHRAGDLNCCWEVPDGT